MNLWSHGFSQRMNQKLLRFLPCSVAQYKAKILTIFGSYFGRNDDLFHSFWNSLTFSWWLKTKNHISLFLMLLLSQLKKRRGQAVSSFFKLQQQQKNKTKKFGIWLFSHWHWLIHQKKQFQQHLMLFWFWQYGFV